MVRCVCGRWANDIRYEYGPNLRKHLIVHVVLCHEQSQAIDKHGEIVTSESHHAWLSSRPLNRDNVHERCNLGVRHRGTGGYCRQPDRPPPAHRSPCPIVPGAAG